MKVTCIIPAYNEEKTLGDVLEVIKRIKSISEIIVVDDGSTDRTSSIARAHKVKVFRHNLNKGKGAAIKTGSQHAAGDILLFLDADLLNIQYLKITSIVQPILSGEADFVKTTFTRKRGRVTELVVKPLFKVILPFIHFDQPLSGQFAIRKELIKNLAIDDRWGVDVQILLQMVKKGVRIAEVDIGRLEHKKQPLDSLAIMSENVIKSILEELGIIAHRHKLIIFDFDKTLIRESSIEVVAKFFGFEAALARLRKLHRQGKLKDYQISLALADILKGRAKEEMQGVCHNLNLRRTVPRLIGNLKKRRYEIGIISVAFSPIVEFFAKKLGIPSDNVVCPQLVANRWNRFTGEIIAKTRYNSPCCDAIICKAQAAKELMRKLNLKPEQCIAVGDGKTDQCLFNSCGLSLAYRPVKSMGDIKITNMAEVLLYAE